jgi:Rad3-related DNA helicase
MCAVDQNLTVNFAPCLFSPKLKQECFEKNRCPYYKTRNEALTKKDSILNYKAFFNLPEFLRKREFYICDEASGIEDELISQYTVNISYAFLQSENIAFKKLISDENAKHWLQDIFIQLKNEWVDLKHKMSMMSNKKNTPSGIFFKQMQRLGRYTELVNTLNIVLERWDECEYLVEKKDKEQVTFVPYDIKPVASYIFDGADKILMMSATISNPEEFAKSLGIKKEEYGFVEIPSTFAAEKSPIYCSTQYNLSYKTIERDLPKIIKMALDICDKHKGQKGIIHTHTNQITEALKKRVRNNPRFLFRETGTTNQNIIEEHKERKEEDTILVSPSLDTGISLDGDLGRFQIIVKAPYLPLNSKRIKKMFDRNPKHYIMKMLDTLIQMSGRCTRSIEDHAATYILDGSAVKAVLSHKHHLPKHFLERFM